MKKLKTLALVIVAIVSACSAQKYHWTHPEKDADQFEADNSYCLAQSRGTRALSRMPQYEGGQAGSFSSGWSTVPVVETMEAQKTIHKQCMTDRGWTLQAE